MRRQAAVALRETEEAQKRIEEVNKPVAAKPEMQSRNPTILGNASQVSSTIKQPPRIIGDSRQVSTGVISKTPLAVIENDVKISPHPVGNNGKTTSVVLEKASTAGKQTKVPDIVNRTTINKVSTKATAPTESSFPITEPVKTTASKKSGLKRASTKTKTTDTTTEAAPGKAKSKKTVPKKISLEQAVPEIELNTEEVLRKVCIFA